MKTIDTHTKHDQELFPGRSPKRPIVARDLLRNLNVLDAPLQKQREAVHTWLATHEANRMLRRSLEQHKLS